MKLIKKDSTVYPFKYAIGIDPVLFVARYTISLFNVDFQTYASDYLDCLKICTEVFYFDESQIITHDLIHVPASGPSGQLHLSLSTEDTLLILNTEEQLGCMVSIQDIEEVKI
jgi:hypothetical protein